MSDELIIILFILISLAAYIQAYQMGWAAGHDVHHEDDEHGGPTKPPKPPLYK